MSENPLVFVISGGSGASGEQIVQTALAQFPDNAVQVVTIGNIRTASQLEHLVDDAIAKNALVVHTLVDAAVRARLTDLATSKGLAAIDLMGPLIEGLSNIAGQPPLNQPGRYRRLHRDYFARVAAIEYTLDHDDGRKPKDWREADILLVGVSRTGKTPVSVYLSVLGWKVANLPLIPELPLPDELYQVERERIVGLTIDLDQLLMLREQRFSRMHAVKSSGYVNPDQIEQELAYANKVCRDGGFAVIDVTDAPIESTADRIIKLIVSRFPHAGSE